MDDDDMARRGVPDAQCRFCIFWSLRGWREEKKAADDVDVHGECRRHAPRPMQGLFQRIGDMLGAIAWATEAQANIEHKDDMDYNFEGTDIYETDYAWPLTNIDDWCGDFKPGRKAMSSETIARFEAADAARYSKQKAKRAKQTKTKKKPGI
jgi:hypothetical protein